MNTKAIYDMLKKLDEHRVMLAGLREEAARLTLNGHQEVIRVSVGSKARTLCITEIGRNYEQCLIRGREMILLGIKKAYHAMVMEAEDMVAAQERAIAAAIKGGE